MNANKETPVTPTVVAPKELNDKDKDKPAGTPKPADLKTLALEHLSKCKAYQFADVTDAATGKTEPRFVGKPGYNPYLYCVQVLQPLEDMINSGAPISEEELAGILKIKVETEPNGDAVKITQMGLREYIEKAKEAKANKQATIK